MRNLPRYNTSPYISIYSTYFNEMKKIKYDEHNIRTKVLLFIYYQINQQLCTMIDEWFNIENKIQINVTTTYRLTHTNNFCKLL